MATTEQQDLDDFRRAVRRMNELSAFDRDGEHVRAWAMMRQAWHRPMNWRSGSCRWPGCTTKEVVKSHTLARSSVLGVLQQAGHVLMPDLRSLPATMRSWGWRTATTFPGYCAVHEQEFQRFEKDGTLVGPSDIALQLLRSADREYANKQYRYDYLFATHTAYTEVLIGKPSLAVPPGLAGEVLGPIENMLHRTKREADSLAALRWACAELAGVGLPQPLDADPRMIGEMQLDSSRRIALSGSTFLDARDQDSRPVRVPVVMAMVPTGAGLHLMWVTALAAADEYRSVLDGAVARHGPDALVDEWLTEADWWCAEPAWWESTEPAWRDGIMRRLGSI